ncbi:hypothetical protein MN2019_24190 [Mycolicibacterium neoaurum]|uniref:helix-turn-helix domain-containing protein n=1 Tax=Mycolicibacterium neoaurum TaxID=1795 RepID=UPI001BCC0F27|nr:helix-turn-helix domain-containing protein [Mycolicibacterium neoaurum]QVI27277.1 hypothetical protein MN2019_24190 [Mycolicibacterium neoaurum]
MNDELADTRFSILLADRRSQIVDRRVNSPEMARALDRVLAVPGFQYLEEFSGTNSLATAFELRRPISVTGDEHFLEALKCFCCYGAPIIHPVTHRLEGVLDVSGPVADATSLLGPFLMRAAKDIEERLLEGTRRAEKHLLAEFQVQGNQRHAVIALGEGIVLTNTAAVDIVKGDDHIALRALAAELSGRATFEEATTLSSGLEVVVRARLVHGTEGGAIFEIIKTSEPSHRSRAPQQRIDADRQPKEPTQRLARTVLVTGEPGSGRTTTAQSIAGDAEILDAADSMLDESEWLRRARAALSGDQPVVLDSINLLSARAAQALAPPIRVSRNRVVMTSTPTDSLEGPHRALASLALSRHDLQPLRVCLHRIAPITKDLLKQLLPQSTVEVAPSALTILAAQTWPGNLRELREVLDYAARGRQRGLIIDADLPESTRMNELPPRPLTMMEAAERDAIVAALRETDGNRAAAAAALGIGRTTLYARLRQYRITDATTGRGVRDSNTAEAV